MPMQTKHSILMAIACLVLGILLGHIFTNATSTDISQEQISPEMWSCSMHPHIQQPNFGQCPLCGMDLTPLSHHVSEDDALTLSNTALQLAQVHTESISRRDANQTILLNGRLELLDNQQFTQSAHISGRIEEIFLSSIGEKIQKGQVIAKVYAPELITAQQELLEAQKYQNTMPHLAQNAQQKLHNWKMSDRAITMLLKTKQIQESIDIIAEYDGVVVENNLQVGKHMQTGNALIKIANLSELWATLDIYESQLPIIQVKQHVTLQIPQQESINAIIQSIDPILDAKTRSSKARILIENPSDNLKPGQWIKGQVSIPYQNVLTIPKTAILWTGKRSVAYVRLGSDEQPSFQLQEVHLGSDLGNDYVVLKGLKEGMTIVSHGAFAIDSAAQLKGMESLMTFEPSKDPLQLSPNEQEGFDQMLQAYLAVKNALVDDNFDNAQQGLQQLLHHSQTFSEQTLSEDIAELWSYHQQNLLQHSQLAQQSTTIEELRSQFKTLSQLWLELLRQITPTQTFYVQYCPMADSNQGGYWLSTENNIQNPYFGASMLTCGEVKEFLE